jgi:cellulose synthase/poly-beta-1,6-N-acetylglucosamine synthase-like glycosyltransferase
MLGALMLNSGRENETGTDTTHGLSMAQLFFWIALALISYAYFGYPLLLLLWPGKRPTERAPYFPSVSFVIAAHNEAARIDQKIRHLLELPHLDRREILVVSDGSTDNTVHVLDEWRGVEGVRSFHYPDHRGKAYGLNLALSHASNQIVVFNDVRQRLAPDAVPLLMENFADPAVGSASGELLFVTEGNESLKTTLYWKYERWLRRKESLAGSSIGATGAFYAIRRELFEPLPEGLVLDDVYTPLQIALRGWRAIHDSRAHLYDVEAATEKQEFRRKVRTLGGNYQLLRFLPRLWRPGRTSFQFFSHKLMRLFVPPLLIVLLGASWFAEGDFYRVAFWGQAAFYAVGALGLWTGGRLPSVLGIPSAFLVLNGAAAAAFWNQLLGRGIAWKDK